jgi:hypothetical protein
MRACVCEGRTLSDVLRRQERKDLGENARGAVLPQTGGEHGERKADALEEADEWTRPSDALLLAAALESVHEQPADGSVMRQQMTSHAVECVRA